MNIVLNKSADNTGIITISVQESDYQSKVEAKLKEISRKTTLPGFRPGKVPTGVIKKMYGEPILIEEVTSLLDEALNSYIKGIDFYIVGGPLPNHDKADPIDWGTQKEFDFEFEIGWVNDFAPDLSPAVSIPQYVIAVDDKMVDQIVAGLRDSYSELEVPETSEANDILTGFIIVNGEKKRGIEIDLNLFSAEEVKPFLGLRINDSLTLDIAKLPENTATRATLLDLPEEEAEAAAGQFTFTVAALERYKLAEMDEEFFDIVLPDRNIKTEEEFKAEVKKITIDECEKKSHHGLNRRIVQYFVEHTSISFPEDFLRRWIKEENEDLSDKELEEELLYLKESLKWDLIERKIAKENNITVEPEEVAKEGSKLSGLQFGLPKGNAFEKYFSEYLRHLPEEACNKEKFAHLYKQLTYEKVLSFIKEKITLDRKEVDADEYEEITRL